MLRNWNYPIRRSAASYLLVILQVHLLGVAMLHWHGESNAPSHSLWAQGCDASAPASSDCSIPCPACQIVQTSSVQPASAAQVLPPENSVLLIRCMAPNDHSSDLPVMSYGRAPPVT